MTSFRPTSRPPLDEAMQKVLARKLKDQAIKQRHMVIMRMFIGVIFPKAHGPRTSDSLNVSIVEELESRNLSD